MRTIIWFIYFWLYLLGLIRKMFKASNARKKGDWETCDAITQREVPKWANSLLKLAKVEVVVEGKENIPTETCVYVANHEGYYDIPVVLTSLPKAYGLMAKKEILKMPFIRTWMRNFRCVFVDRKDPREAMRALNEACTNVKNGHSMIIFPEGTRAKDGIIGEFKGGSFKIATKAKCLIVPVRIEGTRDIMENNGYWMKPGKVHVYILPAIETQGLSKEEQSALPEKIRNIIVADREKAKNNIK